MRRRRGLIASAVGLGLLAALLFVPEPDAVPENPPANAPFVWGQDDVWARLERDFDRARRRGCDVESPAIDRGLEVLDGQLAVLEAEPVAPGAAQLERVERSLFDVAARFGACIDRVPELAERVRRLRRVTKDQSRAWSLESGRAGRDALYRLLYGSRAALEELLLQMDEPPELLPGTDEPSETPSVEFHGVTLHSGDILASRGGAPTSAFIARGNDYPGNFSHIALLHVAEDGTARVIESHIESGVGVFTAEHYLEDTKLRIMVMRMRRDHPALQADPMLPHRAATEAIESAEAGHIPYDFEMDWGHPDALFCSEVAYAAYARHDVRLWAGLSSMSAPGLTRWLASVGVRYFETLSPSDVEYDPQLRV
ncbi:MAG: hypothetical protein KC619_12160, partial [Myxococcales bacterium]|nr:hypothetical protein [Myxococcales bacterium]